MKVYIVELRRKGDAPDTWTPCEGVRVFRSNALGLKRRFVIENPSQVYRVATYERVAPTRKTVKGRKGGGRGP